MFDLEQSGDIASTQFVVLAGGLGIRLRDMLPDKPKILAPIGGHPFIDYLLNWLENQGVRRVVLSLGYQAEQVVDHLQRRTSSVREIETVIETEPLGTAGALSFAHAVLDSDPVVVLNGDSVVEVDLADFVRTHRTGGNGVSVVATWVNDTARYGSLDIDSQKRIRAFREKSASNAGQPGWINAGIYAFSAAALAQVRALGRGSLERDFFAALPAGFLRAYPAPGPFIDIGTSESLLQAAEWFNEQGLRAV